MSLDKPGSRFVLTDEMKYSVHAQISRKTGLVSDYVNQCLPFGMALARYRETKQYNPGNLARVEERIITAVSGFKTYRADYLKRKSHWFNTVFFNGEMTPEDEEDMANDIFDGSPRSGALDQLSIAFKAELDTIKTAADIPRLEVIYAQYEPKFKSLFSD